MRAERGIKLNAIRIAISILVLAFCLPLIAEEQTEDSQTKVKKSQRRVIEEVVVTAQKSEQSLQDVPLSVSSFDENFIKDMGVADMGELVQYTPNVKFNDALGYAPVLTIRGFGTPPLGRGLEPSVGLVIDDIFYGRSAYINDTAFDLKRVEVLRGPQGTLFGKNTIAGVMNFTTRDPDFENSTSMSIGASSFNYYRAEAARSFTLMDDVLALRLSARHKAKGSHVYNTARQEQNRDDDTSVRGKLLWVINDSSDVIFTAWASRSRSVGLPLQLRQATEDSLAEFRTWDPEVEANDFNNTLSMDRDTFSNRDTQSFDVRYTQAIGEFELVTNVGYSDFSVPYALDGDFSPVHFIDFGTLVPDEYSQSQIELRLSGTFGGLFGFGDSTDFIVGVFLSENGFTTSVEQQTYGEGLASYTNAGAFTGQSIAGDLEPATSTSGVSIASASQTNSAQGEYIVGATEGTADSIAVFNQYTWYNTDTVNTTLGWRFGVDRRRGRIFSDRSAETVIAPVVTGQKNFDTLVSGRDVDFAPKIAVSYQPTDDYTWFVSATEGFKSGGFAAAVFNDDNLTFEPEKAVAFEAGVKSKLLDGSLTLNAAYFRTSYKNLQVRNFDGRSIFVKNAADASTEGFELDFFWLPALDFLTVGGSLGLVDAVYETYRCAPAIAGTTGGTGPDECFDDGSADPGDEAYQDLSGQSLAFAPKVSSSLFANVRFPIGEGRLSLNGGIDVLYQGEHFVDTDNDPVSRQPATTKLNLRGGISSVANGWSVLGSVKNITGEEETALVIDQASIAGNYLSAALPSEPVWSVDLRWDIN
ncbi:MAG: iron complex outermembrane receptor protein [Gammaproteobacteria bacterium]